MTTRKYLATIDHNAAVHREIVRDDAGEPKYRVKYSKAAGRYVVKFEKKTKTYEFVHHLLARCLHERCVTEERFHTKGETVATSK